MGNKLVMMLVISAAIVAACSKGDTQATISDGWGDADIKLVTLKDGTRYAALVGVYKGGITCDWEHGR